MNHYINSDGLTVFTSSYHRKKGSCCHSNCLHCPYGTTLKNIGIKFDEIGLRNDSVAKELYQELYDKADSVSQNLLASAFGNQEAKPSLEKLHIMSLKGVPCGLAEIREGRIQSYKLLSHFNDQGITESYLNSLL